ncbi:MAG: hypothetical protein ABIH68_08740 [bacterium]
MEKRKLDTEGISKLKEDMLSEIEFLKARLERERGEYSEKILKIQSENIALRTEFKERESSLLSGLKDLQTRLQKTDEEYRDERRTWEHLLKSREEEKNSLYAEIAVKESESVSVQEQERRRFFEREKNLLDQIENLEKNISFLKKGYEEKLTSSAKEKEEISSKIEEKISDLRKELSAKSEELKAMNAEIDKSQEDTGLIRGENILRENELNQKILDLQGEIVKLNTTVESERSQSGVQLQLKDRDIKEAKARIFETEKKLAEDVSEKERVLSELRNQIERERAESLRRIQELEESSNVVRAESVLREDSTRRGWSERLEKVENAKKDLEQQIARMNEALEEERRGFAEQNKKKDVELFGLQQQIERQNSEFRIAINSKEKELDAVQAQDAEEIKFLKSRIQEEKEAFEKRFAEEEHRLKRVLDEKERLSETILIKEREIEELKRERASNKSNFNGRIEDLRVQVERGRVLLAKREEEYVRGIASKEDEIKNLSAKINEVNADWTRRLKFAEEEIFANQRDKFDKIVDLKSQHQQHETELVNQFNEKINELTALKSSFEMRSQELHKTILEKVDETEKLKNILAEKEGIIQNSYKEKEMEIAAARHRFEDEISSATRQFEAERQRFREELNRKEEEKNRIVARTEKEVAVIDASLKAKETELTFADSRLKETEANLAARINVRESEISGLKLEISKLQEKLRLQLESFSKETERQSQMYVEQLRAKGLGDSRDRMKLFQEMEEREKALQNLRVESETKIKELAETINLKDKNIADIRKSKDYELALITQRSNDEIEGFKKKIFSFENEKKALELQVSNREDLIKNLKEVGSEKGKHLRELFETEKIALVSKKETAEEDVRNLKTQIQDIDRRRKNEIEAKTLDFIRERNRLRDEVSTHYNKFLEASQQGHDLRSACEKFKREKEEIVLEWRKRLADREKEILGDKEKITSLEKQLLSEANRGEKLGIKEAELSAREKRLLVTEREFTEGLSRIKDAYLIEKENLKNAIDDLKKAAAQKDDDLRNLRNEKIAVEDKIRNMQETQAASRERVLQAEAEVKNSNNGILNLKNALKDRETLFIQEKKAVEAEARAREESGLNDFRLKVSRASVEKEALANELANIRVIFEKERNRWDDERLRTAAELERRMNDFDRRKDKWDDEWRELLDKFYITDATRKELTKEVENLEKQLKEVKKPFYRKIFG